MKLSCHQEWNLTLNIATINQCAILWIESVILLNVFITSVNMISIVYYPPKLCCFTFGDVLLYLPLAFFFFLHLKNLWCVWRLIFVFFSVYFFFIFKLYNIVFVLPNIKMNPPQVPLAFWLVRKWGLRMAITTNTINNKDLRPCLNFVWDMRKDLLKKLFSHLSTFSIHV